MAKEVEDENDDDLIYRLSEDHLDHIGREQPRSMRVRLPVQQRFRRGVGDEGKGSESIHDDVDPQQLNSAQDGLLLGRSNGGHECDDDSSDCYRYLELQKLANGVIDTTTPHHSLDDRSEVVIHKNDVRYLLSDLGAGDTHREPNVGSLEDRSIIRATTSDTDDITERADGFNKNLLILGGRPSQDLKARDDLEAFVRVESTKERALHDDTSSSVDTTLCGDRASGKDVVSGTHLDRDTRTVTCCDGLADTRAKGILDTGYGDQGHVAREVLVRNFVGRLEACVRGRPILEVPIAERDCPQHLIGVEDDRPRDVLHRGLVDFLGLYFRVGILAMIWVPGNNDVARALLGEDFRSALEEQAVAT